MTVTLPRIDDGSGIIPIDPFNLLSKYMGETEKTPSDPTPTQVRLFAAVALVGELGLVAWETREEWEIAVPALLLVHLLGLLGFGLYRLAVRWWRKRVTHEELFVSSTLFTALVVGSVTYAGGEWMGTRSALGSLTAGVVVGITLVLARLAIWGPIPNGEPGAGGSGSPG